MTTTDLQAFLKSSGRDRYWLSEQMGVSKRTVDDWFLKGVLPKWAQNFIARIAADEVSGRPTYTPEEFAKLLRAMHLQGYDNIVTYIRELSIKVSEQIDVDGYRVTPKSQPAPDTVGQ